MKLGKKKFSKKKTNNPKRRKLSPEKKEAVISNVKELAEPLCDAENLELVGVDYIENTYDTIIRLYIDKPDGVTLEDCSNVSLQLGDLLDVKLDIDTGYRLEVSSPGI